jgi:hypothetical protein
MRTPRFLPSALLVLGLLASGCSGEDQPSSSPSSSTSSQGAPADAPTIKIDPVVKLGKVVGHLKKKDKQRLEQTISGVAVRWLHAAYLDGSYPRRAFNDSWPGFTAGARRQAHHDKALMSNAHIGPQIDAVNPSKLGVTVDLLAIHRRAVGSTAHVVLRFDTEGKVAHKVYIGGRLRLTPTANGWRVFAYTINRGDN